MTTRQDLVHGVLTDEPQGRAEIAEHLGIEAQAVSVELFALKNKGLADKRDGGWVAGSGQAGRKVHEAVEAAPAPPPGAQAARAAAASGREVAAAGCKSAAQGCSFQRGPIAGVRHCGIGRRAVQGHGIRRAGAHSPC